MHALFILTLLTLIHTASANPATIQAIQPTLVISHGEVYSDPSSDAIAIAGAKIFAVGKSSALESLCKTPCQIINARGGFIMPGFHDSHAHQASGGSAFYRVKVSGSSVESIVSTVRQYATANPKMSWILGRGWNASGFGTRFPTRYDLDRAEPKRPVVLLDSDGHQIWTNSAAITAAKIDRNTPDPEGGTIVRNANGEPTGIFLEDAADLIYAHAPSPTLEEHKMWILKGDEQGIRAGFTSTQGGGVGLATMQAYKQLDQQGLLKQRVFIWGVLEAKEEDFVKTVDFAHSLPQEGKVQVVAFKGFVDGVISSYTAALLEPYSDEPSLHGKPILNQEELDRLVLRANTAGFPVALHAIGDRAVRMSLNAFEKSKQILNHNLVNRIEHIEVVNPNDARRFGALGVAAGMQPSHMHFGSASSSYYPSRLGDERIKHAFAWNELLQGGALLLFGTDYPVVTQDPIEAMTCAVRRLYYDGTAFEPAQKVDGETALRAFTINPAKAIGMEERLGMLKPGYEADIVVLGQDPRLGRAQSLGDNSASILVVAGKIFKGAKP